MKISLNWIKDYVKLPDDLEVSKLMHDLTMSTVEVEGAEVMSEKFRNIVVGVVVELLPHPNADKLRVCRTDIGDGEIKEIVCGGINLSEGMKVAVSKPGAMVRWHGEGEPVEIKNAKLRGVESYGMICASSEIGLFDLFPFTVPSTILDLSEFDAAPGTNVATALGIDDVILEIDNKSLTNRPDLWGHYGIARELSAIYGLPLASLPKPQLPVDSDDLRIAIEDPARCARYAGVRIERLGVRPASFEIRSRIWRVGMRPINAIVDITNYVMLATGQPTHAFDADNIEGGITVRRAKTAERLTLLNGKEAQLTADDLVIADDREAVALAGVMGGNKDSVLDATTKVILEVANFDALGTRKTAQRNELRTEASIRYEKGIDPQRADQAVALAMEMFTAEFPDVEATAYVDNYPKPLERAKIEVSLDWLARRMGKRLPDDTIRATLERLGFDVEISGDAMRVTAPSWRSTGDVSLPDDIMEEAARLYGYENFEATPITTSFVGAINQPRVDLDRRVREYLSFRGGMQEIFTYPWVCDELLAATSSDTGEMLALSTPPAPDEKYIRSSLIPGVLGAVADNARFLSEFSIYEASQVFYNGDFAATRDERERLPRQRRHVAGALTGDAADLSQLFRRAKGIVESLPRYTHIEPFEFAQECKPAWADDTVWLNVKSGGDILGSLALVSGKTALACGIKQLAVLAFELDVDAMTPYPSRSNMFAHLPEFPQTEFDISMIFEESVKWEQIASTSITKNDSENPDYLVRNISFVDEYRGKQIAAGKKSVTLRLLIGSEKKTLTGEEIEKAAAIVSKRLSKRLGGEIRG